MPATDLLSIVVPVYRNAATVAPLHDFILQSLQPLRRACEIVFVVDGSPDDSLEAVLALRQRSPIVTVVSLAKNAGQAWALLVGLRYAAGDPIVTMDADLQDPPSAIPALLAALEPDADVVFAGRRGSYESPSRLLTSRVFKRALAWLSRRRIPADAGLFLVMRRKVAEALLDRGDVEPYLISMLGRESWRLRSVPVEREPREEGRSSYTFLRRLTISGRALRGLLFPAPAGAPPIRTLIDTAPALRHILHSTDRSSA
ncbi:MAG TPA: glycosyltransferase family 2 protein [Thermoanaerobaculia bacterium]|nr:glycosyltransferase family 2 protein [Thermoanaerobaculia bacterium]